MAGAVRVNLFPVREADFLRNCRSVSCEVITTKHTKHTKEIWKEAAPVNRRWRQHQTACPSLDFSFVWFVCFVVS
jgi:hypothetical protein